MVVVLNDHPRSSGPQGTQEGHTVPHLHQGVPSAVATQHLGQGATRKPLVATSPPHPLYAVPHQRGGLARDLGGADADLQTGRRPPTGHLVQMEFGAPGLDIVEIAPRQYVNPSDTRPIDQRVEVSPGSVIRNPVICHRVRIVPVAP